MKRKLLTVEQAFRAMFLFLDEFYQRTKGQAELGDVLGDIQINGKSGLPMDPAAWDDWVAAVDTVHVESSGGEKMTDRDEEGFGFAPERDAPIPYMQRIRDYYQALGYGAPYRWAQYAEVPFAPLKKPLAESRIGLITTAAPFQPGRASRGRAPPITPPPSSTRSIPATARPITICASRISATTERTRRPRTAIPGSRCRRCSGRRARPAGSARSRLVSTAPRPTAATARPSTRIAPNCWRGCARTRSTRFCSSRFDRCVTRP